MPSKMLVLLLFLLLQQPSIILAQSSSDAFEVFPAGDRLVVNHLEVDASDLIAHFQANLDQNFTWSDPALQKALQRSDVNTEQARPEARSLQKRVDNNQNDPAVQTLQCLVCPPSAEPAVMTIDQLSTDWLISQKRADIGPAQLHDKCLFYTRRIYSPYVMSGFGYPDGLSSTATCYARQNDFTSIWMIWPSAETNSIRPGDERDFYACDKPGSWLYWLSTAVVGPVGNNPRLTYFENMSRAMARLCTGNVYVMTDTPLQVPQIAIWGEVEWLTLRGRAQSGDSTLGNLYSMDSGFDLLPFASNALGDLVLLDIQTLHPIGAVQRRDIEGLMTGGASLTERDACGISDAYQPFGEDWFA